MTPNLTLYPAIDLKDGGCVRLRQGEMGSATVYNDNPGAQAAAFVAAGCGWVHVVDLNGAFAGRTVNGDAVRAIVAVASAAGARVQLGGGLRDMAGIEGWIKAGVSRVILGSAAVKTPALVGEACRAFPGLVAVGIDAREGFVTSEGWAEQSAMKAVDLARRVADLGACAIIYTDIARDGMGLGLNLTQTIDLAQCVQVPIIASGGIGGRADLAALVVAARHDGGGPAQEGGIQGVVVGRALYDGSISVKDALAVLASHSMQSHGIYGCNEGL